jgi:hypothetical protein
VKKKIKFGKVANPKFLLVNYEKGRMEKNLFYRYIKILRVIPTAKIVVNI